MVENLSAEWREQRIAADILAIAPGAIATRLTEEVIAAGPQRAGAQEHAQALKVQGGGGATLEKVLELVQFLLSNCSDGLSGKSSQRRGIHGRASLIGSRS